MGLMRHVTEDRRPWGLIVALLLAATAGLIGVPLQVLTVLQANTATQADVERTQELVRQLGRIEQAAADNVAEHRLANDRAHREQCRLILEIAREAGINVRPCDFPPPMTE
jgi:hypothetical protein